MLDELALLGILSAVLSVIGSALNIKKRKQGFLFWIAANNLWLFYGFVTFQIGILIQHSIFLIFSISGYAHWSNTSIILPETT